MFGPKTRENGQFSGLDNYEIHSLYHSLNIIRVIKSRRLGWTGHVARTKKVRVLSLRGKPRGKKPLGRPRHRSEDNSRKDILERRVNTSKWIDLNQDLDY
jgi:hypothetical protein